MYARPFHTLTFILWATLQNSASPCFLLVERHGDSPGVFIRQSMAKRFTSTEKWSDPWYRKLSAKHKCLWDWLFTQCDIAGSIEPDLELASFEEKPFRRN